MRQIKVSTKEIYNLIKEKGYNCKDVGNHYLEAMCKDENIDRLTGDNGFWTKVFENAWDWAIGIYLLKVADQGMQKRRWLNFILRYEAGKWYRFNPEGDNKRDISEFIH